MKKMYQTWRVLLRMVYILSFFAVGNIASEIVMNKNVQNELKKDLLAISSYVTNLEMIASENAIEYTVKSVDLRTNAKMGLRSINHSKLACVSIARNHDESPVENSNVEAPPGVHTARSDLIEIESG